MSLIRLRSFQWSKTREESAITYIPNSGRAGDLPLPRREIAERFQLKRSNAREMLLALEGEGSIRRISPKGLLQCGLWFDRHPKRSLALRYAIEREALREGVQGATREDMVRITLIF